jgi:hypothetical protein
MNWLLNVNERDLVPILEGKPKTPRKIQEEAVRRVTKTCQNGERLLLNMPCRTGKTFTTLYGAYKAGIELVIVLCGKASAKSSYETDSVWKTSSGTIEGYNQVVVSNTAIKEFLSNPDVKFNERVLIEVTPQLLNKHPEFVETLSRLAKSMKTLFAFDEAHFAERTEKTQDMVTSIADSDVVDVDKLTEAFGTAIPWVYITASPDTVSIQNQFDEEHTYEVTKELEWELYLEDLKRPVAEREFNYVPVRNCLYVMNKLMNSVFDSSNSEKQDYTSLFTQKLAELSAKKFIRKSLMKVIEVINHGPEDSFMIDDETAPYSRRGTNINLMIKVPVNSKKTNKSSNTVAERITDMIRAVESDILAAYPEFTEINILDVTLSHNIGQAQANEFFDSHSTAINIILTQQRLIEGATLYNLDGFLYYCNSGSLVKYKQESGRTLNPVDGKRFGFIFFFDEEALSCVKAVLAAKIRKSKTKKHGPRKLSAQQAKRMTRINPAFIIDGNDEMKLIDYSQSLYTKSDLEHTRTRETLFDKEKLLKIPGLVELISGLLKKMSGNTTKKPTTKTEDTESSETSKTSTSTKSSRVDSKTPPEQIEVERFVHALIYTYQDCIQAGLDCSSDSKVVVSTAHVNGIDPAACRILYDNDYTYEVLMEIYEVLLADQENINPEEFEDDEI